MAAQGAQYCRHYARRQCTGCTRLHEPYERQLQSKETRVRQALESVVAGKTRRPDWLAKIAPSPREMGYRTSVKICLDENRYGKQTVGLYYQGSREVVSTSGCPAQAAEINKVVEALFARGRRTPARLYDHQGRVFQRGRLKFLTVRCAPGTREVGLIVSHTGVPKEQIARWLEQAGLSHVAAYETKLTPADGDELTGRYVNHVCGPERFALPLGTRRFEIAPAAFFQANHALAAGLVAAATAFEKDGDTLLDLYGGFGAYSFAVTERFQKIVVVDGNSSAIETASRSAKAWGVPHLEAHAALCERFLDGLAAQDAARVTHALVNPPRNGLSRRVTDALGPAKFPALRELHYVSCNPQTLARDLRTLLTHGFVVTQAQTFDMFPQTDHVETVVRLMKAP